MPTATKKASKPKAPVIPKINPIDALADAKGISRIDAEKMVHQTIMSALAKRFGATVDAEIVLEPEIRITRLQRVVEFVTDPVQEISLPEALGMDPSFAVGDIMETEVSISDFGRYAIGAAKQRIKDAGRQVDRTAIRSAGSAKMGDLITATVLSAQGPVYILRVSGVPAEVVLPGRETNEHYEVGQSLEAALIAIEETPSGPRLVLSQIAPAFVTALFARYSDAVRDGRVQVVAAAREAGVMTKIVVKSTESDPVALYVGPGARAANQVKTEIGNERLDVIAYVADEETMIRRAMEPAELLSVDPSTDGKTVTVTVASTEMGRAMGRKKANVRLASKVTDKHIVLSESKGTKTQKGTVKPKTVSTPEKFDATNPPLSALQLPSALVALLKTSGYLTLEDILDVEASDLTEAGLSRQESDIVLNLLDELTEA